MNKGEDTVLKIRNSGRDENSKQLQPVMIQNLFYIYLSEHEKHIALHGLNFNLQWGKVTALTGPSGSGKTTLLKLIQGVMTPSSGIIHGLEGVKIGYLDQFSFSLMKYSEPVRKFLDFYYPNRTHKELLQMFNLEGREDTPMSSLSFGEAQRLFLLIALHQNPDIFLVDEATAHLDSDNAEIVLQYLRNYSKKNRIVFISTHDHRVEKYADVVIRIEDGYVESTLTKKASNKLTFTVQPHSSNVVKIPDIVLNEWGNFEVIQMEYCDGALILKPLTPQPKIEKTVEFLGRGHPFEIKISIESAETPGGIPLNYPTKMEFNSGEVVGIYGTSGSGKSTFLDWCFYRLDGSFKFNGKIEFNGVRSNEIIYLRQKNLFPASISIAGLVSILLQEDEKEKFEEYVQLFDLDFPRTRNIRMLSGGQKYLLSLALALSRKPAVLVLDETLANIDKERKDLILQYLQKVKQKSICIIMATHDPYIVNFCDKIYRVDKHGLTGDVLLRKRE